MPNTLSKENELQRKAFELYYGLGDKRSLRAVAETIGRTERTVAGWSRAFNWVARVTQRNIENAQNSNEAKITAELTDVRTKYRILINNLKVRVKTEDGIDQWIKVRLCFGCDLAISEKEQDKGDYFVLMVIGVDADHNVYVLDYVKERLTFNTQLNTIIDYGRNKFPMVERIGVETVAYQKSLTQELRRLSLLPIININTSKDKVTRAMRRSANFENHKVYFREGMDDLEECLLLFPEVDHDDLFDALDFAMTMADGGNEIRVLKREDFRI